MRYILIILLTFTLLPADVYARGGFSSFGGGSSGFSSSRSFSSPARSFSPPVSRTVTRTTTTRSYGGGYYGGYHPMMYPGFGMGYGYSNGMLTGLIIGNMMHPQGTVVYTGGGYNGNALLYPDGRVVDSNGYQVGVYANGQFTAQQGAMVAQPVPAGAQPPAQPVVIQNDELGGWQIVGIVTIVILIILIISAILV